MPSALKLDFDRPTLPAKFDAHLFRCARLWGVTVTVWWARRTARGWHVGIHLREKLPPMTAVAMQSALGDDKARVAYNIMKVSRGKPADIRAGLWNVLYREKIAL